MSMLALLPSWLDPQTIIEHGGLWLVAAIVFAESGLLFGFFLPGDSLLFITGFLTSKPEGLPHIDHPLPFVLLGIALLIALGFEFVNGFHDTANAVATVIYTHSLSPHLAVVWSGAWNFAGVLVSSHHLDEVSRIADRIVAVHAGRMVGALEPGGVDLERRLAAVWPRGRPLTGPAADLVRLAARPLR